LPFARFPKEFPMSAVSRSPAAARPDPHRDPIACFSLTAGCDPGLLPRVLAAFAKRGLVPDHCYSRIVRDPPEAQLSIDLTMAGLEGDTARQIAETFRQIPGVVSVLMSIA
jgi:hypothetical protein